MSGGAGHMRDMKNRLTQNSAKLPSKRNRYAKYEGRYGKHDQPDKRYLKEIPHPKLKILKEHIRNRAAKENREVMWITLIFTALIVLVVYWIFF